MTDVVPGEVKVGVMETLQGAMSPTPPVSLPDKFRNPETSGVKYTITTETKDLHIDIK